MPFQKGGFGMEQKEIIRVENLSFTYVNGKRKALDGVSFSVYEGETVGIIGHTGAGKSTLGYCLRGLVPESIPGKMQGEIFLSGKEIRTLGLAQKARNFGIVFQDPESQIIGSMVLEDITFGMSNLEIPQKEMLHRADGLLHRLALYEKRYMETATLSGGQKQRLSIGGVLGMKSNIVFLDEPTTELDPLGKAEVFDMIRAMKEEAGVTILLVSHQTELLCEIADRVLVFRNGRLAAQGKPLEVLGNEALMRSVHERVPQELDIVRELAAQGYGNPEQLADNRIETVAAYIYNCCFEGR